MFSFILQLLVTFGLPALILFLFETNATRRREAAAAANDANDNNNRAPTIDETLQRAAPAAHVDPCADTATAAAAPTTNNNNNNSNNFDDARDAVAARGNDSTGVDVPTTTTTTTHSGSKSRGPKILIAYASNSKNAVTLSHKLFNAIQSQLSTAAAASPAEKKNDNNNSADSTVVAMTPVVKVLELREEDAHACRIDTLLEANPASDYFYSLVIFVVSTFTDGTAPPRSQAFEALLKDSYEDHRVPRDALSNKRFAVFGLGDIEYGEKHFNAFAKNVHMYCRGLGAPHFVVPPVYATEAKLLGLFQVFSQTLLKWLGRATFLSNGEVQVQKKATAKTAASKQKKSSEAGKEEEGGGCCCNSSNGAQKDNGGDGATEGCCQNNNNNNNSSDDDDDEEEESGLDEIEDLIEDAIDYDDDENGNPRELLNPRLRKNLEKQGYSLLGSHSGVKLCRWTKAMLRGRGGCYKHTFYDINSSQCMELTPSLACANKCVFCWRHHTNPVAKSFRWKVDEPSLIVSEGVARHVKMINTMRGVPGVTEENLQKAFTVRHCALSLVGEPIMYPRINEFLSLLHARERRISSFMVTNAQFPEQLRILRPVTQLYLSIDAPTPEELKQIDRPLFEDYWERCLNCIAVIRRKRNTRTVFRLTLVNEMNATNIANYADLVEKGWPDFIEVKGVTFCGTSNANTINMKTNVPRHDEVIDFCAKLCDEVARRRPNYTTPSMNDAAEREQRRREGKQQDNDNNDDDDDAYRFIVPEAERNRPYHIACEHEHSCCVLIALDKFYFNERWNTWINYEKFFELAERYEETYGAPATPPAVTNTKKAEAEAEAAAAAYDYSAAEEGEDERFSFTALDYCAPTPSWAVFRSAERGFDPSQTRVIRNKPRPVAPVAAE